MFKKLFYSIVIIVIIFISIGFFLPKTVHVERSIDIDRPAVLVFTLVDGFATFNRWSPWAARDDSAVYHYSGPDIGVGARMSWQGDPRLSGSGSQEIITSEPYSLIRTRLQFARQGVATAYYQIEPRAGGITLTWGFDSDVTESLNLVSGLMARYFGLLFDRWIGSDYEQGLASLKALAESMPNVDFSDLDVAVVDVAPMDILYVSSVVGVQPRDIADSLAQAYQQIMTFIHDHHIEVSGQPLAISHTVEETGVAFDAAIPVSLPDSDGLLGDGDLQSLDAAGASVHRGVSPSGRAIRAIHRGSYSQMRSTYEKLAAYMQAHGLREGPVSWEQYVSDPSQTPEEELVTHVFFMLEVDDTADSLGSAQE